MNSFGSHHGKIDHVFYLSQKNYYNKGYGFLSLKENQLGSGMAAPRILEFYWEFLPVV
jgi:hypothetical protein